MLVLIYSQLRPSLIASLILSRILLLACLPACLPGGGGGGGGGYICGCDNVGPMGSWLDGICGMLWH